MFYSKRCYIHFVCLHLILVFRSSFSDSSTGGSKSFPGRKLESIDPSSNILEGPIRTSICNLLYLEVLDLSNNRFSGEFPHCLGNMSSLRVLRMSSNNIHGSLPSFSSSMEILDLSNNGLTGKLPHSLGNMSSLIVLNIGSNNIHGPLPITFSNCRALEYIGLSTNSLQGPLTQSLTNCTSLQVLDLKSNSFTDNYPRWLATLPLLQVLDLSSNNFHGPIEQLEVSNLFPRLQILDLSNNKFNGTIQSKCVKNFKAMMRVNRSNEGPQYMHTDDTYPMYQYSIELTFNGESLKYEKIITSLVTFDLSNNAFQGEIPSDIGELVAVHGLNLSHNQLSGPIPPSIGKLTLLNCLDLSHNKLTGHIPQELVGLTSIGVFNVSENQLVGRIPQGFNFKTYGVDSYEGNLGLCGTPLPECVNHGNHDMGSSEDDENSDNEGLFVMMEWKIIMLGYISGTIVGLAWGYYMLLVGRPLWLIKRVDKMELAVLKSYNQRFSRQQIFLWGSRSPNVRSIQTGRGSKKA